MPRIRLTKDDKYQVTEPISISDVRQFHMRDTHALTDGIQQKLMKHSSCPKLIQC